MTAKPLNNKKLNIFSLSALGALALTLILRTAALLLEFDTVEGYFSHGAVLPMVFNIICVAAVILFGAFALFGFKKGELTLPKAEKPLTLAAFVPAIASAILTWSVWSEFLEIAPYLAGKDLIFAFPRPILSLVTVIFFFCFAMGLRKDPLSATAGILSLFAFALELTNIYNDLYVSMISPNKLLIQISCIAAMLYILCELRVTFTMAQPRFFLFSLATATLICGASSLPSLAATVVGAYENPYILQDLMSASVFLLCLCRFIGIMRTPIFSESFEDADDGYVLPDELEETETHEELEETETTEEPQETTEESQETTEESQEAEPQ